MATLEQALKYVLGINDMPNRSNKDHFEDNYRGSDKDRDSRGGMFPESNVDNLNGRLEDYNLQDIIDYNNRALAEAAKIDREFQQSSAREAMQFEADQAEMNRNFQQSSAREAMQFEADQAQINRDFQEKLANTAYQRASADLKAAGLNPALAYTQGGAATTSGATASGFATSGSTASGRTSAGSKANVDTSTISSLLVAMVNAASNESIATYNGLLKAGGLLGQILSGKS